MSEQTPFVIEVAAQPFRRLAGLKIRTTPAEAPAHCDRLWRELLSRRGLLPVLSFEAGYGVSRLIDPEKMLFDYWAAWPVAPTAVIPPAFETVDMAAGPYAICRVSPTAQAAAAYAHINQKWLPAQTRWRRRPGALAYELYPAGSLEEDFMIINWPLLDNN